MNDSSDLPENATQHSASPAEPRVSAKATRKDGALLSADEIEEAEAEAEAWARQVNCC
jgi:hypothetical protein